MTKNQADGLSENLVRLMLDMEDDLLHLVAEQLAYDPRGFSDTSKWRIRQLARAGLIDKEAARLIASYTGIQSEMLREAVENAAYMEMGYVDAAVRDLQRRGLLSGAADLPAEDSAMFAYRAYLEQAESDLNMVNTVMLYNTRKAYVTAVNRTYDAVQEAQKNHWKYELRIHDALGKYGTHMTAGTMSLQEATRRCIKELSERGIPAFIDHSGREWSPEAYITMDLRSTLGNTARAAQNMRCDQYGIKLIEVSSHLGARPLCAPYQGRIYSRDGTSGTTTDGDGRQISYIPLEDTSYGQPAGLFGINCGHLQYPFVAGCSFQTYFPYDEEENAERYKEFQKQRYMERQIRNTKRECAMLNATGDKEGFEKASLRLRSQKEKYKDFSEAHGLRVHNDRTQVNGFDKSVSSKTSWAARKADGAAEAAAKAAKNHKITNSGSHGSAAPAEISIKGGSNGGTGKTYTEQRITESGISSKRAERTAENAVNWDYINSAEYKNKFKGITGNAVVDRQIYKQSRAQLVHRDGTYKEDMCLIHGTTGKIVGRQSNSKSDFGVDYNQSLKNAISNNPPYSLISVHNHPTNNPPTGSDIVSNGAHKYMLGVIPTHDGKVFIYKAGNKPFSANYFSNIVDKMQKSGYNEYDAIIYALERVRVEYGIEWSERK